jgi:hypothetical protein
VKIVVRPSSLGIGKEVLAEGAPTIDRLGLDHPGPVLAGPFTKFSKMGHMQRYTMDAHSMLDALSPVDCGSPVGATGARP